MIYGKYGEWDERVMLSEVWNDQLLMTKSRGILKQHECSKQRNTQKQRESPSNADLEAMQTSKQHSSQSSTHLKAAQSSTDPEPPHPPP